jgi:hypothetical protein
VTFCCNEPILNAVLFGFISVVNCRGIQMMKKAETVCRNFNKRCFFFTNMKNGT